jgi:hypothetical protein
MHQPRPFEVRPTQIRPAQERPVQVRLGQVWLNLWMGLSPRIPVPDVAFQEGDLLFPVEICPADVDLVWHRIPRSVACLTAA